MKPQSYIKPDLVSVIEKYTGDKAEYGKAIRCPFHGEHEPSLHIYDNQTWYCFGCNKFGDVYDFVGYMRYSDSWNSRDPVMFREISRELNNSRCKTTIFDRTKLASDDDSKELPKESMAILKWVSLQYHNMLFNQKDPDAAAAREYLKARGYSEDVMHALKIGYSGKNMLKRKAYTLKPEEKEDFLSKMKNLGLMKNNHEYFFNRIVFPNVTKDGQVLNLTGRAIGSSNKRYLNIPGVKRNLYLIELSNPELPLYLTESVTDTVSMRQLGFQAVAVNGTALTKRMVLSLEPFKNIVIVPQNDLPSVNAAGEWSQQVPRCKIMYPEYIMEKQKDINDILKQEGEKRTRAKLSLAAKRLMTFQDYSSLVLERLKNKE